MLTAGILGCTFFFAAIAACQEQPQNVSLCQLQTNPTAYDHKLVEVTGFVSHDFENFTVFNPTCLKGSGEESVWLEYGGKFKSDTIFCCGPTAGNTRPHELVIEKIRIPLIDDARFREFDKLIQPPFRSGNHGSIVHATLRGRFFSGKITYKRETTTWEGYGHLGCCSLLAIQQIVSVSPQDRDDLDYGASLDQPELQK